MKKIKAITFVILIFASVSISGVKSAHAFDLCPTSAGLGGWWGKFYPSTHGCGTSYYTYNNTNLGDEESRYFSEPAAIMCGKPTPPLGPTYYLSIGSRAYIPAPDSAQTHHAQYYTWNSGTGHAMIGIVDQYNTFGWAYLATTAWSFVDKWKLSDTTGEGRYSKKVDLDAFSITNCP